MLYPGLWLRFFLVQGRCGQKDPRKPRGLGRRRAWRILEVRRTARLYAAYRRGGREDNGASSVPVRECGGKD